MFLSQQPNHGAMDTPTPEEGFTALTDDAERNRLLAEMAEQSTDMISRHTPGDWRFIYASPAVTHLLGYSVEEIVGVSAYDLYHPDDVENFQRRAPSVRYERGLYTHTYRFRCKDGHYTWLESTSRTLRDPDTGDIREILVVSRDASGRIEAEQTNRRLARVLESTSDLVIFTSLDHRITHLNESARQVLALDSATPSAALSELFTETSYRLLGEAAFPTALRRGNWSGELDMRDRRGQTIPVSLELLAHRSYHGDMEYFSLVARDLSAAKAAEAQLKAYQADIEHASRLVTMGELASSLAHELNQPLTGIVNYLRGIQRRFGDQTEVRWQDLRVPLEKTVDTALRAGGIIHRMMDFTRKRAPVHEAMDLLPVVDDLLQFCEPNAERHNVVLENRMTLTGARVVADRIQLEQILLNLIVNAIEACQTPAGQAPLKVWLEAQRHGRQLEIRVRDQGPGLPPHSSDKLFERFFTTKKNGLGMGLAISRSLVESLGGELWPLAVEEGGACFCFTLALADDETPTTTN